MLQKPEEGKQGFLRWKDDTIEAIIDWDDPVIAHALRHRIKYARIIQRKASSPQAEGTDAQGYRYYVHLSLEGLPHTKPEHQVGKSVVGMDLGPSTIAIVPREGEAQLSVFCEEIARQAKPLRRLQRKMDRQRRSANPENYDEKGRIKRGKRLHWKNSKSYQKERARKATKERKLAAHRKSLHGKMAHEIIAFGNTIQLEKISYKAWQKNFGKSVQRDLYSAFLAAFLEPKMLSSPRGPGYAESASPRSRYWKHAWDGVETRLAAAHAVVLQRANNGQSLPRSMSVPRARARQPESLSEAILEPPLVFRHDRV